MSFLMVYRSGGVSALGVALSFFLLVGLVRADEKGVREIEAHNVGDAEKTQWARAATVPLVDAVKTALIRIPGQAIQATLEALDGRLVYEIEIVTGEGKVVEVFVDPRTGKLVEGRR